MDVEKTMQFILEQQAKHEVWLQEMREGFRQIQETSRQTQEASRHLQEGILQTQEGFRRTHEGFDKITEIQLHQARELDGHQRAIDKLFESQQRTDQAIKSLVEQGRHTDDRLNALIKVVDDLVRRNGSSKKR